MGGGLAAGHQPANDNVAVALGTGARLLTRHLGWPCGFIALGSGSALEPPVVHGDLVIDPARLRPPLSIVLATARPLALGVTGLQGADPPADVALPANCTGFVAAPLVAGDGAVIGVLGALDDRSCALAADALDGLADLADLIAASVGSARQLAQRDAEAVAAEATATAATERQRLLCAALDSLPHFFWINDTAGRYVVQNAWDREVFGDLTGRAAHDLVRALEMGMSWSERHRRVLAGETVRYGSWRRHPGSQGERWVESVMAPIVVDDAVTGLVGLTVDRTEQAAVERQLRQSEARLADYVDTASDWVWETDAEHRLVHLAGLPAKPKLPADRVLGKRRWEVAGVDPKSDPAWRRHLADLEARRPFRGFVLSAVGVDGATFWFEINGNPVFDEARRFIGYRGTGRDVTERVMAERRLRESEARLADYLEMASDWLWETDAEHRLARVVGSADSRLLPSERLLGRRRWEIAGVDPAHDPFWREHLADLEARRPLRGFVYAYRSDDIPELWIEINGNPVFDASGTFVGYRGTARDVTRRQRADTALREAHAKLDALSQSGLIGIVAGHGFLIEEANDAFLALLGLDREDLEGGLDWRHLLPDDEDSDGEQTAGALGFTGHVYATETTYRHKSGARVPVLLNIVILDGTTERWFALVQDLTPMKLAEARVRDLAERDGLTGLANRHVLFDRLKGDLDERRRPGACGALLLLDLDGFKAINDTLGHEAGDQLLQIVGHRLTAAVRETDTVARVGGDEFAVILRGLRGPAVVTDIADKLLAALREPLVLDGRLVRPNGSLGISLFPGDGSTPAELLKKADVALYEAKANGQGACRFFEPALLAALEHRRRLAEALGAAIGSDAFEVVLQPRMALDDGRRVGFEAFVRWRRDGVELLPGAFIGIAEESGRMPPLGRQFRRLALTAFRRLAAVGSGLGTLALNVTASELKEDDFAASLGAELIRHGIPPGRIEIEVTEGVLLDRDSDKVMAGLRALRRLGVGITLDDFGTGFASLTHLRRFPLDRLAIDRSIVQDIGVDADEAVIVRSIINLAHTLGLTVLAEGVETAEQLTFLRLHGCDFAQGYHLAEPLPPAALELQLAREAAIKSHHLPAPRRH